jgi:hypothetical protein
MSKSYENAQTNAPTLFMSLLPLLVCIKILFTPFLPLYHVESSFSLPLYQQLTQKWDQIVERKTMFDGVG